MMANVAFDTLAYVNKLTEAGFDRKQAEAQAQAQVEIFNELMSDKLAARQDVSHLDTEIKVIKSDIEEIKSDIKELKMGQHMLENRLLNKINNNLYVSVGLIGGLIALFHFIFPH